MNERIIESFEFVFFRCKSCKAIFEYEYPQWINICNQNINSEIKFKFID